MPRVDMNGPNEFQKKAMERVDGLLAQYGYPIPEWTFKGGKKSVVYAEVDIKDEAFMIEAWEDCVQMEADEGRRLYEIYLPEEFESKQSELEYFLIRLDRFLRGGPWAGPDETGFLESCQAFLKRLVSFD